MVCNFKPFRSLLDIVYPPLCLHCEASLDRGSNLLCTLCLEQLALIDYDARCKICFAEMQTFCKRCASRSIVIKRQAAACYGYGPAQTLTHSVQKGHLQFLPALSSLMFLQFSNLEWPMPDFIVSIPSHLWTCWTKGDVSTLLAKEMSSSLDRPQLSALRASLDRRAFLEMGEFRTYFSCKKKVWDRLCDKRVLLISVHLEDNLVRKAAEALQEAFPREIYALAFRD